MSLLADIATLEEAVAAILDGVGEPLARADAARVLTDAVLAILDTYDLDALAEAGPERIIAEVLSAVLGPVNDDLARDVAARTQQAVRLAAEFYQARGIDPSRVSEAVTRAGVTQQLTERFQEAMRSINSELLKGTTEVMQDTVLSGTINRTRIEADVLDHTGVAAHHARTQAQVTISSFNQEWRNELARQALIDHFLYFGTLQLNSRHFCRIHLNRVFTTEQIAQMRNGMLEPVTTFKGGYRCRHQWLPVDPEWDEELRAAIATGEPTEVGVDAAGRNKIAVIGTAGAVQRLKVQIALGRRGFILFEDGNGNDRGFVAINDDWWHAFMRTRQGTSSFQRFEAIREQARETAAAGQRVDLVLGDDGEPVAVIRDPVQLEDQ